MYIDGPIHVCQILFGTLWHSLASLNGFQRETAIKSSVPTGKWLAHLMASSVGPAPGFGARLSYGRARFSKLLKRVEQLELRSLT
jgi:hypothetical protein